MEQPLRQVAADKDALLAASRVGYLRDNYRKIADDLEQIAAEEWDA